LLPSHRRYPQHHLSFVGLGEFPPELALHKAEQALKSRGLALEDVYPDARMGTNGGLRKILDIIAEAIEREHTQAYIDHVLACIDPMDNDQIEALMHTFVRKFGRHLPYQLRSPGLLVRDWKKIILETVKGLQLLQQHHPMLKPNLLPGRGGIEHKVHQHLVGRHFRQKAFVVKFEYQNTDLALQAPNTNTWIAVEIVNGNSQNVRERLQKNNQAGAEKTLVIASNRKTAQRLQKELPDQEVQDIEPYLLKRGELE